MALTDLALLSCNGRDHGLGERAQGRPGETNWMGDPGPDGRGGPTRLPLLLQIRRCRPLSGPKAKQLALGNRNAKAKGDGFGS
jgi:hypothetical protein